MFEFLKNRFNYYSTPANSHLLNNLIIGFDYNLLGVEYE